MLRAEVTKMFLRTDEIVKSVNRERMRRLVRAGAYVWRAQRNLIRKRNKPSQAGSPPHGHGDQLLRKNIFFHYDRAADSVVIGPALLNRSRPNRDGEPTRGTTPLVLDEGGSIFKLDYQASDGVWWRTSNRNSKWREGMPTRLVEMRIGPRPYKQRAIDSAIRALPSMFRGLL